MPKFTLLPILTALLAAISPALVWGSGPARGTEADPVTRLQTKLASGEVTLEFDNRFGYLPALLRTLDIPVSSQTLVFSKTSAQFRLISAASPRALYFNDEVYVGWVRGGPFLEVSVADPNGAGIFFTFPQDRQQKPRFTRDNGQCLQCHESGRTLRIPGHLTRSVYPDGEGQPYFEAGSVDVDQTTPIEERWGGWYVTGSPGGKSHRGNATMPTLAAVKTFEGGSNATVERLNGLFDVDGYLSPHSDIVAHLVLTHQTQMHNHIALARTEAQQAIAYRDDMKKLFGDVSEETMASVKRRIEGPAESLLRHLLFVGEAELAGHVAGTSDFAEEFSGRGPRDGKGRSLREFDLKKRIFRYPCSYLIYSGDFQNLPGETKAYVYGRLWEVLSGRDQRSEFAHLSSQDRTAIREILHDTMPEAVEFWSRLKN